MTSYRKFDTRGYQVRRRGHSENRYEGNLAWIVGVNARAVPRLREVGSAITRLRSEGGLGLNEHVESDQKGVCERHGVAWIPLDTNLKIGIARNVKLGLQPINGLRHPPKDGTSGWYIWAGEELSDAPDFFVPLHASHLADWCPLVVKYLGLPPGYRFLVADNYEDVWVDEALLTSDPSEL